MDADPPWFQTPQARTGSCAVIGGGIAGCAIAYALDQRNIPVCLLDQYTPGSGASSNPRAVLRPHLVRQGELLNRFNASAFTHCVEQLATLKKTQPIEYELCGVLQLIDNPADWPEFESSYPVDVAEASRLGGIDLPAGAVFSPSGGWVNLQSYCHALLNACQQVEIKSGTCVIQLNPVKADSGKQTWQIETQNVTTGREDTFYADNVVIANGPALLQFSQTRELPLTPSTGQTTRCLSTTTTPAKVITGKRYLIPDGTYCTVGATHHRLTQVESETQRDSAQENTANLTAIADLVPTLTGALQVVDYWHGRRASAPDRLPLVGAVPDLAWYKENYASLRHGPTHQSWPAARYHAGLYVLGGLGSRGLVSSALAAQVLAGLIAGKQQDNEQQFRQLLHPARFMIRTLQRNRLA